MGTARSGDVRRAFGRHAAKLPPFEAILGEDLVLSLVWDSDSGYGHGSGDGIFLIICIQLILQSILLWFLGLVKSEVGKC